MPSPDREKPMCAVIHQQLSSIRAAAIQVAEPETSCWPKQYAKLKRQGKLPSPLWNHCAPMAHMVRGCFGGEILEGMVNEIHHFWNRLPDGTEVDLTSCQFGGDGFTPMTQGTPVPTWRYEPIPFAFLWFADRVLRRLSRKDSHGDRPRA
jgi:hypothetical protein